MIRRLTSIAAVLVAAVAFAACSGQTSGAYNITKTSAQLNADGVCSTDCDGYFYLEQLPSTTGTASSTWGAKVGHSSRTKGAVHHSYTATNLLPGQNYRFQVCVSAKGANNFTCVGPDGKAGSFDYFSTKK